MAFKSYYKLVKYKDLNKVPFYVEDVSGSTNTIPIQKESDSAPTLTIETSLDGNTWTTLGQTSTTALNISVPANGRVYVRCNTTSWGIVSGYNIYSNKFQNATGNYKVGGNIMSLLYGSNFTGNETTFPTGSEFTFSRLFYGTNNMKLVDASSLILPATTLSSNCYQQMFYGCTSLTQAPVLPATTLAESCYSGMFFGCTSLTQAPVLPATTLAESCYSEMFYGCASLTQTPSLPATTLSKRCYGSMFSRCTSLTTAPTLPATTLAQYCYNNMFDGCTSLNSITVGVTRWYTTSATNWVNGVSATGTFTKPSATTIAEGTSGIPSGWTVVNV